MNFRMVFNDYCYPSSHEYLNSILICCFALSNVHTWLPVTRLPMGAKCCEATYCGLWVQRLGLGSGLTERVSRGGPREARWNPITKASAR